MGWRAATAALDALHRAGCRIVVFEGGEPLLWRDGARSFADLARCARERFLCTAATTNGTLPLDVPVDVLWVSLDGTRETHNRLRSGSWWRAPLVSSSIGSALDTAIFFSIAFTGSGLPWTTWALGDFSVKMMVAVASLLPYASLMNWVKPYALPARG